MKRIFALLFILLLLPMTRGQMIHRIRCQKPELSYEDLYRLPSDELRSMMESGM